MPSDWLVDLSIATWEAVTWSHIHRSTECPCQLTRFLYLVLRPSYTQTLSLISLTHFILYAVISGCHDPHPEETFVTEVSSVNHCMFSINWNSSFLKQNSPGNSSPQFPVFSMACCLFIPCKAWDSKIVFVLKGH